MSFPMSFSLEVVGPLLNMYISQDLPFHPNPIPKESPSQGVWETFRTFRTFHLLSLLQSGIEREETMDLGLHGNLANLDRSLHHITSWMPADPFATVCKHCSVNAKIQTQAKNFIMGEICCAVWQWQRKQLTFTPSVIGALNMSIT